MHYPGHLVAFGFIISLLTSACSVSTVVPDLKAADGVIDLSTHDFTRAGVVTLGGTWMYFPGHLITTESAIPRAQGIPVQVPQTWSGDGFGTYFLKVRLPPGTANYKLHMEAQLSAYDVYISGARRAASGYPGNERSATIAATAPLSAVLGPGGEYGIFLRVANFHHRKGGLFKKIQLGTEGAIDQLVNRKRSLDVLLAGILFMTSIYYLIVFLFRHRNRAELFFALVCLAVLGRTLTTGEKTILMVWPQAPFAFYTMVEYLSYFWGIPLALSFFASLYPQIMNRCIVRFFYAVSAVFTVVVVALPLRLYSHTAYVYMPFLVSGLAVIVVVLARALWGRRENALLLALGFAFLALTVLNDVLNTLEIMRTGYLVQYGFMAIVVCFSAVLAARFARALDASERAEHELRLANESLEDRVSERTRELEEAKNSAEEANRQKDSFLAVVSHDLRSPLSGILTALQALHFAGPDDKGREELLSTSEQSAGRLLRTIDSLLAVRRAQAAPEETRDLVSVASVVRDLFTELAPEADRLQVRLVNDVPTDWRMVANITLLRHVLLNLLSNALKFTPAGKSVVVFRAERSEHAITVRDEGVGLSESQMQAIRSGGKIAAQRGLSGEKGSGLGLSICRELLARSGGRLEVESEPGHGSAFTVVLADT